MSSNNHNHSEPFNCVYTPASGNPQTFEAFYQPLAPIANAAANAHDDASIDDTPVDTWLVKDNISDVIGTVASGTAPDSAVVDVASAGAVVSTFTQQSGTSIEFADIREPALRFKFNIKSKGVYHLSVAARRPSADTSNDQSNDIWIGITGAVDTASTNYTNALGLAWDSQAVKAFLAGKRSNEFSYQMFYNDHSAVSLIVPLVAGEVNIVIAGRSHGVHIRDCILYRRPRFTKFGSEDMANAVKAHYDSMAYVEVPVPVTPVTPTEPSEPVTPEVPVPVPVTPTEPVTPTPEVPVEPVPVTPTTPEVPVEPVPVTPTTPEVPVEPVPVTPTPTPTPTTPEEPTAPCCDIDIDEIIATCMEKISKLVGDALPAPVPAPVSAPVSATPTDIYSFIEPIKVKITQRVLSDKQFDGIGIQTEYHGLHFNNIRPADPYGYTYPKHHDQIIGKIFREMRPSFVRNKQLNLTNVYAGDVNNVNKEDPKANFNSLDTQEFFSMMRHCKWANSALMLVSNISFLHGELGERGPDTHNMLSGMLVSKDKQVVFARLFVKYLKEFHDAGYNVKYITPINEMETAEGKYMETQRGKLAYKQLLQEIEKELTRTGLNHIKQIIFDQNNAFIRTPGAQTNALENMLMAMADPEYNEITGAYGVHSYPSKQQASWRGYNNDDLDAYMDIKDRFTELVTKTKLNTTAPGGRTSKPYPFVVGEFGAGKNRYPQFNEINDRRANELFGLFIVESSIAMLAAGVDGVCYWTLNDLYYASSFRHGLISGPTEGYFARPVYYIYGQLSRWCRGPSGSVFETNVSGHDHELIRAIGLQSPADDMTGAIANASAGAIANAHMHYRFILASRHTRDKVVELDTGSSRSFRARVYIYRVGAVPQEHENVHNDLQPCDYILGFRNGKAKITIPAESAVLVAEDDHFTPPSAPLTPRAQVVGNGVRISGFNLRNTSNANNANANSDIVAYYRIYRGRHEDFTGKDPAEESYVGCVVGDVDEFNDFNLGSTADIDNEWILYKVQAVDKYGNESKLSNASPMIRVDTEPNLINPNLVYHRDNIPQAWTVQGKLRVVPGLSKFNDFQKFTNDGAVKMFQRVSMRAGRYKLCCTITHAVVNKSMPPVLYASGNIIVGGSSKIIADVSDETISVQFETNSAGGVLVGINIPDGQVVFGAWSLQRQFINNPEMNLSKPGWTHNNMSMVTSNDAVVNAPNRGSIEQIVNLPANTAYVASVYAKMTRSGNSRIKSMIHAQIQFGNKWVDVGNASMAIVEGIRRYSFEFDTTVGNVASDANGTSDASTGTIAVKLKYTNENNGSYELSNWELNRVRTGHRYDPYSANKNLIMHPSFKEAAETNNSIYSRSSGGNGFLNLSEYLHQPWTWTHDYDYTTGVFSYSSDDWYIPARSLKLNGKATGTVCRQVIPSVRTRIRYRLTFAARVDDAAAGTTAGTSTGASLGAMHARVGIKNKYGAWVAYTHVDAYQWKHYSLYFTSTTSEISVCIEDTDHGVVYFDEFDLRRQRVHSLGQL